MDNIEILLCKSIATGSMVLVSAPAFKANEGDLVSLDMNKPSFCEVIFKWYNPSTTEVAALEMLHGMPCRQAARIYSVNWEDKF